MPLRAPSVDKVAEALALLIIEGEKMTSLLANEIRQWQIVTDSHPAHTNIRMQEMEFSRALAEAKITLLQSKL